MTSSKPKRSMHMGWAAGVLLAIPLAASAGSMITYHCVGESVHAAPPWPDQTHQVIDDYTLDLSTPQGRYWDWKDPAAGWRPIYSIKGNVVWLRQFIIGPALHGFYEETIDRSTGYWMSNESGGQQTTQLRGDCQKVALRRPPVDRAGTSK